MAYIPHDNLDDPVFVETGQSVGSGFYAHRNDLVFFVTARHILFDALGKAISKNVLLTSYFDRFAHKIEWEMNLDTIEASSGSLKTHPTADVAVIRLAQIQADGRTIKAIDGTRLGDVVMNYLKDRPQERTYLAASTTLVAIAKAWPCPK